MKKTNNTKKEAKKMSKNRYLLIFVCIFVSFVLVFGTVLGIVIGVENSKCVLKYENVRLEEGEVRYLASVFKSQYIKSLVISGEDAKDTERFWASDAGEGKTHGELLRTAFREYISGIVVKNFLYLNTESFGKKDKQLVKNKVDERLMYLRYDSEKDLNSKAVELGFDYDDFISGTELLYKANAAFSVIYGTDGKNLAGYKNECEEYLKTYSHVALIFLKNEEVYVYDESGNLTYDEDGSPITRKLNEEERAERLDTAQKLREYIKNLEDGNGNAMSAETFEKYMKEKSDTDPLMIDRGYYFHENAQTTASFAAVYPEIVERAFAMDIGEYAEVQCDDGVCFIYKYDVTERAYADSDNVFFSDFYYDAANYNLNESVKALAGKVVFDEKFDEIDIVEIPSNSQIIVNFSN